MESWRLSLKSVALYRDGSKLSQPLNTSADDDTADDTEVDDIKAQDAPTCKCGEGHAATGSTKGEAKAASAEPVERVVVKIVERPLRRRLPDTRASITHKFDIMGHEGYITVGLFEDSTPGEVFITMAKQGSTIGGLMDTIATLISLNLQYGVPLDAIVRKFEHMRFEPSGMTTNSDIPFAKSFVDYIVRWMGMQFVAGYRQANAPKREGFGEPSPEAVSEVESEMSGAAEAPTGGRELLREPAASNEESGNHGNHGNHGNGGNGGSTTLVAGRKDLLHETAPADALNAAMSRLMGDAPTCTCGSITVRNGSCYKCLNCGASLGCS
jgi:ribonucleoside-diphosphate reductase alpha chain